MSIYIRKNIRDIDGYTPGEQPREKNLIKLNTNENPYPPSPKAMEFLKGFNSEKLRLYPDPMADNLRKTIAELHGFHIDNIIAGNGSDDILNIAIRTFLNEDEKIVCFDPSYSLYPILARLQNANTHSIDLSEDFSLPENFLTSGLDKLSEQRKLKLFLIANPNAPTGNAFLIKDIEVICSKFKGIVLVDEAYADFAEDNAMRLLEKFDNLIISRTLSKSYSMAGVRLGWAVSNKSIIREMIKVKDSYNVNMISQFLAIEALKDRQYFAETVSRIKKARSILVHELVKLDFKIIPSQANFLFVSPPEGNGNDLFLFLRTKNIIVRYFPAPKTKAFIRITIGREEDMQELLNCCREYLKTRQ
ncbi:MAG TPA: histidinol-phosphate transaminase [Lentisphaeria bacterium]|nr:MAG: histidinol-phosphate transaminase [Lentisphaerae bacterium GWF2_38_69]HBM17391.1 histidinol-phosphate transaminase [Lentisphaeria bacterium]